MVINSIKLCFSLPNCEVGHKNGTVYIENAMETGSLCMHMQCVTVRAIIGEFDSRQAGLLSR